MAKATSFFATCHGTECAYSEHGQVFKRYQNRTPYGYRWSAWAKCGDVGSESYPTDATELQCGFNKAYLEAPGGYRFKQVRLPF